MTINLNDYGKKIQLYKVIYSPMCKIMYLENSLFTTALFLTKRLEINYMSSNMGMLNKL